LIFRPEPRPRLWGTADDPPMDMPNAAPVIAPDDSPLDVPELMPDDAPVLGKRDSTY